MIKCSKKNESTKFVVFINKTTANLWKVAKIFINNIKLMNKFQNRKMKIIFTKNRKKLYKNMNLKREKC